MPPIVAFINAAVCVGGKSYAQSIYVDLDSGLIVPPPSEAGAHVQDLDGLILAPAFLELQTNGCAGFHFTQFADAPTYQRNLENVSRYLLSTGVGSFWATIPTVEKSVFHDVSLRDWSVAHSGLPNRPQT